MLNLGYKPHDVFVGPLIKYNGRKMAKAADYVCFMDIKYHDKKRIINILHDELESKTQEVSWADIKKRI